MMKKFGRNRSDNENDTATDTTATRSTTRRVFTLTLVYTRGIRAQRITIKIYPDITFYELKKMISITFGIDCDVSDLRLCLMTGSGGLGGGLTKRQGKKEIKARDDECIYVALNDRDTVYIEQKQRKSPPRGNDGGGNVRGEEGLVPAVTGFAEDRLGGGGGNVKVIVHQVPTGGRRHDIVEEMGFEYEVSDLRDGTRTTIVDGDDIPRERLNNGVASSQFAMDLHHHHHANGGGHGGYYRDTSGSRGGRSGEDDAAIARRLQEEEYTGRGGRRSSSRQQQQQQTSDFIRRRAAAASNQYEADMKMAEKLQIQECHYNRRDNDGERRTTQQKNQWNPLNYLRSSSSQQQDGRDRPLRRSPPRPTISKTKIVPDPGRVVLRGTTSQYSLSPGGESACTSICLFAAREFLTFNRSSSREDLASVGEAGLDFIVRCGIDAHQSLGSMHASIDELWSRGTFKSVASTLEHGAPFGGMVNSTSENGFKQGLLGALEFARNHQQQQSSSSSASQNVAMRRVAVVITKPPETILCVASSCDGEGGTWYIFDSHGESNASTKLVYLKQYNSIDAVVQGLMHKFPGACMAEMGGGLQAEMYNSFEATPLVYQPGGGGSVVGGESTSMARAMEESQRETPRQPTHPLSTCSGGEGGDLERAMEASQRETLRGIDPPSSSSGGRDGELERAMEESRRQQQQQQQQEGTIGSQPPRCEELEKTMKESKQEVAPGANNNLRTQSAPAASSHDKTSDVYCRSDLPLDHRDGHEDDSRYPTRSSFNRRRDEDRAKELPSNVDDFRDHDDDDACTMPKASPAASSSSSGQRIPGQCDTRAIIGNDGSQDGRYNTKETNHGGESDSTRTVATYGEKQNGKEIEEKRYPTKISAIDEGAHDGSHDAGGRYPNRPMKNNDEKQDDEEFEENRFPSKKSTVDEKAHDGRYPTKKLSLKGSFLKKKGNNDKSDDSQDGRYPVKKKSSRDNADQICAPMGTRSSKTCGSDDGPVKGKLLASGSYKMDKEKKKPHVKMMNKMKKVGKKTPDETSAPSAPALSETESAPEPKSREEPISESFLDPIFHTVMADPVICEDGFTYDRPTIERHFRTRTEEEERRQREEEEGQAPTDGAVCCGARREIQLTSPKTNEVISGLLLPNRNLEQQIVELVEAGHPDLSEDDIADWKERRQQKRENDRKRAEEAQQARERQEERRRNREEALHRRREEEAQVAGQPTAAAVAPQVDQRPLSDQVRVDRMVFNGLDNLSEHDIGLSVALCDENDRCFPDYASSISVGNVPRCMVACCAQRLVGDYHWCARCGRMACSACLNFHATDYANRSSRPQNICFECVTQIIDVMDPSGTEGQARAFIANVTLRRHNKELTDRAIALQDQRVKTNAENQFGPGLRQLEEEVRGLESTRDQIQAKIRNAEARARNARNNDGSSAANTAYREGGHEGSSIAEWEETCADLQRQYNYLLQKDVPYLDEEAQIMHFTAISDVESRLEQAQMTLSEMQSKFTESGHHGSSVAGPTNSGSVEEWEEMCDKLKREYTHLTRMNVPRDEFSQIRHIEAVSEVTARLEEAQTKLYQLRAEGKKSVASSNEFSVDGKNVNELEKMCAALQREYDSMLSQAMPVDESSQLARIEAISLITDRLETVQMSLAEAHARGDLPTATKQSRGSDPVGTDDPLLLVAIGSRDNEWPLPLGLSYPTTRMENQLEFLKNALAQELSGSERKYDDEYGRKREELTIKRDRLEDEIERAKAEAQNAEASAEMEQRRLQEREERRRREEEERRERERVRLERERRAREEADQLRQKHASDEEATRAAFANVARGQGGAAAFGGRGDLRMCRVCKAGPIENIACSDLAAHNDNSTSYKGNTVASRARPNNCPNCDWFDADWNNWPLWDGITGPH